MQIDWIGVDKRTDKPHIGRWTCYICKGRRARRTIEVRVQERRYSLAACDDCADVIDRLLDEVGIWKDFMFQDGGDHK